MLKSIFELSAKYESGGDAGCVSNGHGDLGGISYGIYQLSSNAGSVQSFLDFACNYENNALANYGRVLSRLQINSQAFIQQWRELGRVDQNGFTKLQNEYAKAVYFDNAAQYLQNKGYDINTKSLAMQAVLMSRSVQYSAGNMAELYTEAVQRIGHPNLTYVNDARFDYDMIANIYDFLIEECNNAYARNGLYHSPKDWANGSYTVVKVGLKNRFVNEKAEALSML
jgi:hypothetical protein